MTEAELDAIVRVLLLDDRNDAADAIERLRADNAALRKDAERYRWLRSNPITFGNGIYCAWDEAVLDATVDAAMLAGKEKA